VPSPCSASRSPRLLGALAVLCLVSCSDDVQDTGERTESTPEQGIRLHLPTTEPVVRVRLESSRDRDDAISIGERGFVLEIVDASDSSHQLDAPVVVEHRNGDWIIRSEPKGESLRHSGSTIRIRSENPIRIADGDHRFSGVLHCIASDSGGWHLVEHVRMEDYIPGVLAGELYAGWNFSCYAAQAVAARSFACMEVQMRSHRDWDVVASPTSQAYVGITENRTAHEAQAMTRGMVLSWNGQLVPGYYSSCCGGLAAVAVDQIGPSPVNDIPPLEGHDGRDPCTKSPLYTWEIDRSARTLHRRFQAWATHRGDGRMRRLTSVQSIDVHQRNPHGRPNVLRITDRGGRTADLTIPEFLEACNYRGAGAPKSDFKPLWSGWATGSVDRGRIVLAGHGFGHGVGLCQYGAQELGTRGKSFREILNWYYPESEIHSGW